MGVCPGLFQENFGIDKPEPLDIYPDRRNEYEHEENYRYRENLGLDADVHMGSPDIISRFSSFSAFPGT
jgi:hypothetical protein